MRNINQIIVHCSATPPSMSVGAEDIRRWHLEKGWSDIGYGYVIKRNGEIEKGRDIARAGAHAKGYNRNSIGICLVGGVDENGKPDDNYRIIQYQSLKTLIHILEITFPIESVLGHRDLPNVNKPCPCFDVQSWLEYENERTF